MTRPDRTAVKRPGAGVTVDRERLIRMREIRLMSRAQLAAKMSGGPCQLCGMPYSHKSDCPNAGDFTITPDAIAKIENGYRRPKTITLGRLCEALGCDPEDILPAVQPTPSKRRPCPKCGGLYAHDAGCPDAT
jgi:transcriptional regulator with XRE-family HTH domain